MSMYFKLVTPQIYGVGARSNMTAQQTPLATIWHMFSLWQNGNTKLLEESIRPTYIYSYFIHTPLPNSCGKSQNLCLDSRYLGTCGSILLWFSCFLQFFYYSASIYRMKILTFVFQYLQLISSQQLSSIKLATI